MRDEAPDNLEQVLQRRRLDGLRELAVGREPIVARHPRIYSGIFKRLVFARRVDPAGYDKQRGISVIYEKRLGISCRVCNQGGAPSPISCRASLPVHSAVYLSG